MFLFLSVVAALFFTSGGAFMKTSEGLTRLWPSLGCFACFITGAAAQAWAMRGNPMGVTHIFILGLEAVLALVLGAVFFHESITVARLAGAVLIVAGMVILRQG